MALALAWMIPRGGWGADLYLSASTALQYDSNVLRTENDQKHDIVFRGTPRLELREADGNFTYSLSYQVPYERGFTENTIDDFSHFFITQAGYAWGGRNDLQLWNNLRYRQGINNRIVEDDDEVLRVNDDNVSILSNDLTLNYNRNLTPRLAANLTLVNSIFETDQDSRSDAQTYGVRGSLTYALTRKHRVGGGFGGMLQSFEEAQGRSSSEATFFNVFGLWSWQIDPTTLFEIRGGPTLIDTTQDAPPSTFTTDLIPFVEFDGSTSVSNYFNSSGEFKTTPVMPSDGSVAVSDFNSCPSLAGGGDTVIIGGTCATLGVLFSDNPPDFANITTVTSSPNTISFSGASPSDQNASTITFFGSASLTKRWSAVLSSSLSYVRRGSTASGLSGATTVDSVSLSNTWTLSELWSVGVRGDWTQRKSISDSRQSFIAVQPDSEPVGTFTFGFSVAETSNLTSVLVNEDVDTQRWGIAARLSRVVGRNGNASLSYTYNKQSSKSRTRGSGSDFGNHRVSVGFQYNFDPIRAW